MKISLIISFLSHIILLLAFQRLFPFDWGEDMVRTYRVDIIRPPAENIDFDNLPEAVITQIKEAMKTDIPVMKRQPSLWIPRTNSMSPMQKR